MTEYQPKIDEIVLTNGETFIDARLNMTAQTLPGFIAINGELKDTVRYVSVNAISSILIKEKELSLFSPDYYLNPARRQ